MEDSKNNDGSYPRVKTFILWSEQLVQVTKVGIIWASSL